MVYRATFIAGLAIRQSVASAVTPLHRYMRAETALCRREAYLCVVHKQLLTRIATDTATLDVYAAFSSTELKRPPRKPNVRGYLCLCAS